MTRTFGKIISLTDDRVEALVHKLSDVPYLPGSIIPSVENQLALGKASQDLREMIQARQEMGMSYDDAVRNIYEEQGQPPLRPHEMENDDRSPEIPEIEPGDDPELSEELETYKGPDTPVETPSEGPTVEEILRDSALALDYLSKLLELSANITDPILKAKLQKELRNAIKKMQDGRDRMIRASQQLSYVQDDINATNAHITDLVNSLNQLTGKLNSQMASVQQFATSIMQTSDQIGVKQAQLVEAKSNYEMSKDRSKYPPGKDGLKQWREDQQKYNTQVKTLSLEIVSLEKTRAEFGEKATEVGREYNSTLAEANTVRGEAVSEYSKMDNLVSQRTSLVSDYNTGATTVREGYNDINKAIKEYQSDRENILLPMVEGSFGAKGLSKALNNFSEGNNASAIADVANTGLGSYLRNYGSVVERQFGGLWSATLEEAGRSIDQTIRSNGDFGDFLQKMSVNSGNRLLGVSDFINVGKGVDNMMSFLDAGDVPGAMEEGARISGNLISGISKIGQTVGPFTPIAPFTPLMQAVTPAIQTITVGGIELGAKILESNLAPGAYLGEKIPLSIGGRGLGMIPGGPGPVSTFSLATIGSTAIAYTTAENLVASNFSSNRDVSSGIILKIQDIAKSGNPYIDWGSKLRVGSITLNSEPVDFRLGDTQVSIRPGYTEPAGTIGGD